MENDTIVKLVFMRVGSYFPITCKELIPYGISSRILCKQFRGNDTDIFAGVLTISDVKTFVDTFLDDIDQKSHIADCVVTMCSFSTVKYYGMSNPFLDVLAQNWNKRFMSTFKVKLKDITIAMPSIDSADYTGHNPREEGIRLMEEIKSTNATRCEFAAYMQKSELKYYYKYANVLETMHWIEDNYIRYTYHTGALRAGIRTGKTPVPFESLKRKREGCEMDYLKSVNIVSAEVEKIQKMVFHCTHNGKALEDCGDCSLAIVALGVIRADIQAFFDGLRENKK